MEVPKEVDETEVNEIEEGQKSTKNNEVGEITLCLLYTSRCV